MLVTKNHLKARFTASTDKTRPVLTTIQLTVEKDEVVAVATNGYILSEVREPVLDDQDFPNVADITPITEARIQATTADAIAKSLKSNKHLPILNYAHVGPDTVTTTNLEQTKQFKDAPIEGNFPDYNQLIPKTEDAESVVTINPQYLATMAKLFKDEPSVRLELHGKLKAVVFRADKGEHTITGVLMPLKD